MTHFTLTWLGFFINDIILSFLLTLAISYLSGELGKYNKSRARDDKSRARDDKKNEHSENNRSNDGINNQKNTNGDKDNQENTNGDKNSQENTNGDKNSQENTNGDKNNQKNERNSISRAIKLWSISSLASGMFGSTLLTIEINYPGRFSRLYTSDRLDDISDISSVLYNIFAACLYFLIADFFFYSAHRFLLHNTKFYNSWHAIHHTFKIPVSWATRAIEPIESILSVLYFMLPALIVPMSFSLFFFLLVVSLAWSIWIHTDVEERPRDSDNTEERQNSDDTEERYDSATMEERQNSANIEHQNSPNTRHGIIKFWHFVTDKFLMGRKHHHLHHWHGMRNYNFAIFFQLWDRLFSTYKPIKK